MKAGINKMEIFHFVHFSSFFFFSTFGRASGAYADTRLYIFENNSQLSTVTNRFSFSLSLEILLLSSLACNFLPAVSACSVLPVDVNSRFLHLRFLSLSFHDRIPFVEQSFYSESISSAC